MSFHFLVRFEPQPGKATAFRTELMRSMEASRTEPGCLDFRVFESVREPYVFYAHSQWVDEPAFDVHAEQPHTRRFLDAAEGLLTHEVRGFRSREIGGGPGAGSKS
ncbi:MAG: antibiotic biosynthesis monooxygenase [Candidatus Eremiobacteraeota bacterium]|nr:antibiotic biosynthesis monooxygenase [Candidatus Eremiobacteraeota bacterium]MBV8340417.1 antibiotic biosynthesis monooxygenase [Candidatus Eremiobacteraeota bacterium]MBV8671736.1 antibiotic biosynthesis monooxygenase [Candidatus Eremiobacteraeota bacterium]